MNQPARSNRPLRNGVRRSIPEDRRLAVADSACVRSLDFIHLSSVTLDTVQERLTETCLLMTGLATSIRDPELVGAVCCMIVAHPPNNSNRFCDLACKTHVGEA